MIKNFILGCALLAALVGKSFAEEPWKIVLVTDMTAYAALAGEAIESGLELAITDINEAGGLLGRPVALDIVDHRGNASRGVAGLEDIINQENLLAVVAGVQSHVALATLPLVQGKPVIMLAPWSSADGLTSNDYDPSFVFRLSVRDEWVASFILGQMKDDGCESIALLAVLNGWGRSNRQAMLEAAEALEMTLGTVEWVTPETNMLPAFIQNLVNNNTDCLITVAGIPDVLSVTREIATYPENQRVKVYSHWGVSSGLYREQAGEEVMEKVYLRVLSTVRYDQPKTERGEELVALYEETYGRMKNPEAFHGVAHSYDLMNMFAQAVRSAKSSDQNEIRKALRNINFYNGAMKLYQQPFKTSPFEALQESDYILVPFTELNPGS